MQAVQESLIRRDDTFLGVCQALGEDFGFNPVFLRIAFGVPLIFSPTAVLAAYFGLGIIVLISRLLAPRPRRKVVPQTVAATTPETANEGEQLPLPIAA